MIGRCLPGMYGWTKGWVCKVAEKAVIGLDLTPGLTPRKCRRERCRLVGNKDKVSYGKSNAPLQRVSKLWLSLPVPGRELRTRQERNSMKF